MKCNFVTIIIIICLVGYACMLCVRVEESEVKRWRSKGRANIDFLAEEEIIPYSTTYLYVPVSHTCIVYCIVLYTRV